MPLVAASLVDCYERLLAEAPRSRSEPSLYLSMSLDKWVQVYKEDPVAAVLELLNFFIHASGLPGSRLDLANAEAARAVPCPKSSRALHRSPHHVPHRPRDCPACRTGRTRSRSSSRKRSTESWSMSRRSEVSLPRCERWWPLQVSVVDHWHGRHLSGALPFHRQEDWEEVSAGRLLAVAHAA